jgi:hypothetical protein
VTSVDQGLVQQARDTQQEEWTVEPCEECGEPSVEPRCRACVRTYWTTAESVVGGGWQIDADNLYHAVELARAEWADWADAMGENEVNFEVLVEELNADGWRTDSESFILGVEDEDD